MEKLDTLDYTGIIISPVLLLAILHLFGFNLGILGTWFDSIGLSPSSEAKEGNPLPLTPAVPIENKLASKEPEALKPMPELPVEAVSPVIIKPKLVVNKPKIARTIYPKTMDNRTKKVIKVNRPIRTILPTKHKLNKVNKPSGALKRPMVGDNLISPNIIFTKLTTKPTIAKTKPSDKDNSLNNLLTKLEVNPRIINHAIIKEYPDEELISKPILNKAIKRLVIKKRIKLLIANNKRVHNKTKNRIKTNYKNKLNKSQVNKPTNKVNKSINIAKLKSSYKKPKLKLNKPYIKLASSKNGLPPQKTKRLKRKYNKDSGLMIARVKIESGVLPYKLPNDGEVVNKRLKLEPVDSDNYKIVTDTLGNRKFIKFSTPSVAINSVGTSCPWKTC